MSLCGQCDEDRSVGVQCDEDRCDEDRSDDDQCDGGNLFTTYIRNSKNMLTRCVNIGILISLIITLYWIEHKVHQYKYMHCGIFNYFRSGCDLATYIEKVAIVANCRFRAILIRLISIYVFQILNFNMIVSVLNVLFHVTFARDVFIIMNVVFN